MEGIVMGDGIYGSRCMRGDHRLVGKAIARPEEEGPVSYAIPGGWFRLWGQAPHDENHNHTGYDRAHYLRIWLR